MKHTLALVIALVGCAHGVEDPIPTPDTEQTPPPPKPNVGDRSSTEGENKLPCDRREVVTFEIDGGTVTFKVPSLCDPTPYIEKGDPPPWQTPSIPTSR